MDIILCTKRNFAPVKDCGIGGGGDQPRETLTLLDVLTDVIATKKKVSTDRYRKNHEAKGSYRPVKTTLRSLIRVGSTTGRNTFIKPLRNLDVEGWKNTGELSKVRGKALIAARCTLRELSERLEVFC